MQLPKMFQSTNCSVCGGPGACRTLDTWAAGYWGGAQHEDSRVCAYYLSLSRQKKKELSDHSEYDSGPQGAD